MTGVQTCALPISCKPLRFFVQNGPRLNQFSTYSEFGRTRLLKSLRQRVEPMTDSALQTSSQICRGNTLHRGDASTASRYVFLLGCDAGRLQLFSLVAMCRDATPLLGLGSPARHEFFA